MNKPSQTAYIPTLDGWRAIAIIAVIFRHDSLHELGLISSSFLYKYGQHGVDLFFAISGLLICGKLLNEEERTGSISLKDFYLRRVFRIQPAALMYLLCVSLLSVFGLIPTSASALIAALLMFRNYYPSTRDLASHGVVMTNHFWSLSLEEHFYLLLPGFLKVTRERRIPIMLLLLVILYGWSCAVNKFVWLQFGPMPAWRTDYQIKSLLLPATLAMFIHGHRDLLQRRNWLLPTLTAINLLVIALLQWCHSIQINELWPSFFTLLVASTMLNPSTLPSRMLEIRPVKFLGRMSYSLYLWQQLLFTGHDDPSYAPLGLIDKWPMRLVVLAALAITSYYLIEKPFISLGQRFSPHRLLKGTLQNQAEQKLAATAF